MACEVFCVLILVVPGFSKIVVFVVTAFYLVSQIVFVPQLLDAIERRAGVPFSFLQDKNNI